MSLSNEMRNLLTQAYAPCCEFAGACREMRWQPDAGHVPRGFFGATGGASEVELILVFAEPGDPYEDEIYSNVDDVVNFVGRMFETGRDKFHRNVRHILDMCWPEMPFSEQLRRVWLTDSVLCSARVESGNISTGSSTACGRRYLVPEIKMFPNALVVALGGKAASRLKKAGIVDFLKAYSAAPPGCNYKLAQPSWNHIPTALNQRRSARLARLHQDASGVI